MIFDLALKSALGLASPAGPSAKLSILIFHRVLPRPDPIFPDEVDAAFFDQLLGWLKAWFNVLPLDQAVAALQAGTLPSRAAAITFDDGYADNHDIALPILKKHGLTATFFIATGYLDGGRMWNDTIIESVRSHRSDVLDLSKLNLGQYPTDNFQQKRAAIQQVIGKIKYLPVSERIKLTEQIALLSNVTPPNDLMMNTWQVKNMRREGMQIGAHTASHPILAKTDLKTARIEILQSKEFLQGLLNESVNLFAYPNGKPGDDYLPEHVALLKELGFHAAVSTQWGVSSGKSCIHELPRFTPWNKTPIKFFLGMMKNIASNNKNNMKTIN